MEEMKIGKGFNEEKFEQVLEKLRMKFDRHSRLRGKQKKTRMIKNV